MTPPNCTIVGNPRFAAPRSYWRGCFIGYGPSAIVTLSGNVIHVTEPFIGGTIESFITLAPNFVAWSSNNWTVDHIFIDQYSQINGGPHLLFHANIGYGPFLPNLKFGLGFAYDGGTVHYNILFQDAPAGYWLPELP